MNKINEKKIKKVGAFFFMFFLSHGFLMNMEGSQDNLQDNLTGTEYMRRAFQKAKEEINAANAATEEVREFYKNKIKKLNNDIKEYEKKIEKSEKK